MNNEPVAYAAVAPDGSESIYVASLREQAEAACREYDWVLIPLYPGPQAWQDETAAVEAAFERSGVKPTWPADEAGNIAPMAETMADEIARLREAIRRLTEQDATLSVREGNVTVDMDAALTDEERFSLTEVRDFYADIDDVRCNEIAAAIDGLLERTKGASNVF